MASNTQYKKEWESVNNGVDFLVTTPERLSFHMDLGKNLCHFFILLFSLLFLFHFIFFFDSSAFPNSSLSLQAKQKKTKIKEKKKEVKRLFRLSINNQLFVFIFIFVFLSLFRFVLSFLTVGLILVPFFMCFFFFFFRFFNSPKGHFYVDDVNFLVVDEADTMFNNITFKIQILRMVDLIKQVSNTRNNN